MRSDRYRQRVATHVANGEYRSALATLDAWRALEPDLLETSCCTRGSTSRAAACATPRHAYCRQSVRARARHRLSSTPRVAAGQGRT
jgi:hypothetical protein